MIYTEMSEAASGGNPKRPLPPLIAAGADMEDRTAPPAEAQQLALIRSITSHAVEGDEPRVLAEVQAILNGAGIADLLLARMDGAA